VRKNVDERRVLDRDGREPTLQRQFGGDKYSPAAPGRFTGGFSFMNGVWHARAHTGRTLVHEYLPWVRLSHAAVGPVGCYQPLGLAQTLL